MAHLRVSESVLLVALAVTGILSISTPYALPIVSIHLVLMAMIVALSRHQGNGRLQFIRDVVPPALSIPTLYLEMATIVPWVHDFTDHRYDAWLLRADRAIFGDVYSFTATLSPGWVELLTLGYWTFYVWPFVIATLVYRNRDAFGRVVNGLTFAYLLSYVGYYLLPARGPHHFEARPDALEGFAVAGNMHDAMVQMQGATPDAFPSAHVSVSLTVLALAFVHHRRLFWVMLPFILLLVNATWALRYHYVVDSLAGTALVPVVLLLVRFASRPAPQESPILVELETKSPVKSQVRS